MFNKKFIFLILLFICSHTLFAKQTHFTVSYDPDYAPFSYKEDNQVTGLLIDIWKLWAEQNNYQLTFIDGKLWDDAVNMARNGNVDFFLGTEVYEDWMKGSKILYEDKGIFFGLKEYEKMIDENSIINVGIIGSDYKETIMQTYVNAHITIYEDYKSSMTDLLDKKIDLIYDDKIAIEFYSLQNRLFHKISSLPYFVNKSNLQAISNSNRKILLFNKGFEKLPDEKLKKLEKKWIINATDYFYEKTDIKKLEFTKEEREFIKTNILRTSVSKDWKPITFQADNQIDVLGISSDYWKIIAKKSGLESAHKFYKNPSEQIQSLKNKSSDLIYSTRRDTQKDESFIFSKKYASLPISIATLKDENFIKDVSSLFDKKVVVRKNSVAHKLLKNVYPHMKFIVVNTIKKGLGLVDDKKAFAFVDIQSVLSYNISKLGLTNLKISGNTGLSFTLRFMIREDYSILKSILDKTIDSIPKNDINVIVEKWNNIHFEEKFDYSLFWKGLIVIFLIFMAFIYRGIILNRLNNTLEVKVDEKTKELQELNKNLEDIIEQKTKELIKQQEILAQQSKMAAMGEILENISHQWRQPLSVITAASSGVALHKELDILTDDVLLESMDNISDSAQYLSDTIDDFKNFFNQNKNNVLFNLSSAIKKAMGLIKPVLTDKNIKIVTNISNAEVYGIENELIQVILNIFNNSIDAFNTDELHGDKFVLVETVKKEDSVLLTIKDSAGGINEAIIDKVFEPYFTTKHEMQGTGIGLYMSFEIITKHMKGELFVKNTSYVFDEISYKGAQFTIKLPLPQ